VREPPQRRRLSDGRLHLNDGPIDLVIEAFGATAEVERAYDAAWRRFSQVLDELCAELPLLRRSAATDACWPEGRVARRMFAAVAPFAADAFVTPMAAVAGSVAEEILEIMTQAASFSRAYVNNGGDIALYLAPGTSFRVGMVDRPDRLGAFGRIEVAAESAVRGIATSGRHGRSFSLGIADAVTVLAASASQADAAATLVANAVDLPGHPAIRRAAASNLDPQSDLGDRLVTRDVGSLNAHEVAAALAGALAEAERFRAAGRIVAAALHLQGETRICGDVSERPLAPRSGERVASAASRVRGGATLGRSMPLSSMSRRPSSGPLGHLLPALRGEGKQ
jgi:ApbE superfamily uncharacterized protein (UPF0280 family)